MNERIQELAEQAGYTEAYYYSDDGPFIEPEFNKQKFAELILKECIDAVSDCSVEYCTRRQIVSEIKEHFGVEV